MSDYQYLVIPRLEVIHANAKTGYLATSPDVVMAARQMGHALARVCGLVNDEAGVCLVHHHVEMLGEFHAADRAGKTFYFQQRRGAVFIDKTDYSDKNKHALSLLPEATMHLRVSLVLRYSATADIDLDAVRYFLRSARLAGGQVITHGEASVLHGESDVRKRLRTGFVVVERPDLLAPAEGDADELDPFFRALLLRADTMAVESQTTDEGPRQAWLSPAVLGYAAITEIAARAGARGGYPSAYAESLLGLTEYISLRGYGDTKPLFFWDYTYPQEGVVVLTQANT